METEEEVEEEVEEELTEIPEDYAEFTKYRDGQDGLPDAQEASTADEEATPSSESADEAGQTAAKSEIAEEAQQDKDSEGTPEKPADDERETRMSRRMRKLSGTIAALEARIGELSKEPDADEETTGEVASPPEEVVKPAEPLVRPMLKDFEDTEELSAWDQYEAAMEEYHEKKTTRALGAAIDAHKADLAEQARQLELKHAKETADREWSKAASRYPDFNEVLKPEVQISQAMEAVMRMDPETGTDLAYYLGQHPEESERIAKSTLATNEREWGLALARAGMELGKIRPTLKPPSAGKGPVAVPPKAAAATPATQKKVSTASKPPTTIRGGVATPKFDTKDEDTASDFKKWNAQREKELAANGKR